MEIRRRYGGKTMERKEIIFTRGIDSLKIIATSPDGSHIDSQSIEALLLYEILFELKKVSRTEG